MRLSIYQRFRLILIYITYDLHFTRGKFRVVKELAEKNEKITISLLHARKIIKKWLRTGVITDNRSISRGIIYAYYFLGSILIFSPLLKNEFKFFFFNEIKTLKMACFVSFIKYLVFFTCINLFDRV